MKRTTFVKDSLSTTEAEKKGLDGLQVWFKKKNYLHNFKFIGNDRLNWL